MSDQNYIPSSDGDEIVKKFQLFGDVESKSNPDEGKKLAKFIESTLSSTTSYFFLRNSRFKKNRDMAHGRYDVNAEFSDRLGFNGKFNYANLMWIPFHIINTIISRKVGSWMERGEKIQITATDPTSVKELQHNYELAEFELNNKQKLQALQQASGMPMSSQDTYQAEDKMDLDMWSEVGNRLPIEIGFEKEINNISDKCGFYDILKEKILWDSAEVGLVAVYTDSDAYGNVWDEYVKPENSFYSYSEYPDFRDCTWMGNTMSLKMREIRQKYGVEFGGTLTEVEIFELAKYAQEYQRLDKITWVTEWQTSLYRPYDEWNLECMRFEWKSVDRTDYSMSVSSAGTLMVKTNPSKKPNVTNMYQRLTSKIPNQKKSSLLKSSISNVINQNKKNFSAQDISQLKSIHSSIPDNELSEQEINQHLKNSDSITDNYDLGFDAIPNENKTIYKGVYAKAPQKMLEWGIKKRQIKPQSEEDVLDVHFGYSFYMYQNYDMRNLAIPEKVEEPYKNMVLTRLKMQQLVMKMKPIGAAINERALRNIDYGLADMNKDIDYKKLYDQAGDIYYNDRDPEGNPIGVPITELSNSGFLPQMQGLIQLYAHHYQVLINELGENPELAQQAATPRVAEGNIQQSIMMGDNATDYMYDAYLYVMEMAAQKKACLVNDTVRYGAKVLDELIGEQEINGRIFNAKVKMMPNQQDLLNFQNTLNQAVTANPQFAMFINVNKVIEIAKEDLKLAWLYYDSATKKMNRTLQEQAMQNQQLTIQGQIQSAQAAEEAKMQSMKQELALKKLIDDSQSRNKLKETIVSGVFMVMSKGIDVQPEWKNLVNELIQNVATPVVMENIQSEIDFMDATLKEFENNPPQQTQDNSQPQNQPT